MKRLYEQLALEHFESYDQMLFLAGPRQVGKTTVAQNLLKKTKVKRYLNWDLMKDKERILEGVDTVVEGLGLDEAGASKALIVFDEIHKYSGWKNFLKGYIDLYKSRIHTLVTGSSRLNVFRRGGDSLMGRYFLSRMHPLSVGELLSVEPRTDFFRKSKKLSDQKWQVLFEFGGFPEPFLKQSKAFSRRWHDLRQEQVFNEDIRDLTQVQELGQLQVLGKLLQEQVGGGISYDSLSKKIRVSDQTIRRWLELLESVYYCFMIRPWYKNVAKSLRKEPKAYLWDWSVVKDKGARIENFVASHLFKSVHYWTDNGLGKFDLHYLRDTQKREVDFLISKDEKPWMLVEVKASGKESLSSSLLYFQEQLQAPYVFQVAFDLPYRDVDCFSLKEPKIVSARTLLSQLV